MKIIYGALGLVLGFGLGAGISPSTASQTTSPQTARLIAVKTHGAVQNVENATFVNLRKIPIR